VCRDLLRALPRAFGMLGLGVPDLAEKRIAAGLDEHSQNQVLEVKDLLFRRSWADEATFTESIHPEI